MKSFTYLTQKSAHWIVDKPFEHLLTCRFQGCGVGIKLTCIPTGIVL